MMVLAPNVVVKASRLWYERALYGCTEWQRSDNRA